MAFDVFLFTNDSAISDRLINALDEQGVRVSTPMSVGLASADESGFSLKVFKIELRSILKSLQPALIINLLPVGLFGKSTTYFKQSLAVVKLAALENIALLQESSHYGLEQNQKHSLHKLYKELDRKVLQCEKSLLLRRGLLLDDTDSGMLYQMCQAIFVQNKTEFCDKPIASPVAISDMANVLCALVLQIIHGAQNWGEFSYCSADNLSEVELADVLTRLLQKAIAQNDALNKLVFPSILSQLADGDGLEALKVTASEDAAPVFESSSIFTDRRLTNDFGIQQISWRDNLANRAIRIFKTFALERLATQ